MAIAVDEALDSSIGAAELNGNGGNLAGEVGSEGSSGGKLHRTLCSALDQQADRFGCYCALEVCESPRPAGIIPLKALDDDDRRNDPLAILVNAVEKRR